MSQTEDETPRLPLFPEDPPAPPADVQAAVTQLIYAISLGIYKLHTLLDIVIEEELGR